MGKEVKTDDDVRILDLVAHGRESMDLLDKKDTFLIHDGFVLLEKNIIVKNSNR